MSAASSLENSGPIRIPVEPVLDGVQEEDRANVRNAIYMLHALKLCLSWSVTPKDNGYEIMGTVDHKSNFFMEMRDMELIKRVDPLRVTSVGIRMLAGGPSQIVNVVVFVMRKSEPVVLEEQDIVQIRRKRKFWGFG